MNRKWIHRDDVVQSSGLTATSRMPNGMLMFLTANDKGEMKPVHECLTVESGKNEVVVHECYLSYALSFNQYMYMHISDLYRYSIITTLLGRDFEKVVRHNTIFHYNPYTGGRETHEEFWKGREFEVLLCPPKKKSDVECWTKGKVVSWYVEFQSYDINCKY